MEASEETITRLCSQLREADEEKIKAAQYGLKLLENENLLQNRLDELQKEIVTITENFEQEKYTLQREVELKNTMLESLNLECENFKQQQSSQMEMLRAQLERQHGQEINQFKNKMEKLKSELDETLLSEKQLKHKVDYLKEVIASKSEELRVMSERVHETMSSEVLNLQLELQTFEEAKGDLEGQVRDLQYSKEQLELWNRNLTTRAARLEEEKEEKEKDLSSYCSALAKAREANRDLQIQLDHTLRQNLDFSSKGNSLFAEVEDRRAEAQRQLISLKVKYQLLQKEHAFTREQLQRLKLQMASLLRMKGSQGEHDQLERLQSMLQQKNGELEELLTKMKQQEKPTTSSENSKKLKLSNTSECIQFKDGYYSDLLQIKLENSEKEVEKLKNELSLQRMKALFESQRVLEMERKLFASARQLETSQSETINLNVLLDELTMKYEPEELMRDPVSLKKALVDQDASESETSYFLSQNKEAAKQSKTNLKATLQALSVNIGPTAEVEDKYSQSGRKRVKIEEFERTSIDQKNGSDVGASHDTRSDPRIQTNESTAGGTEETNKCEKKGKKKNYPLIHVSSKQGSETQCTQQ